MPGTNSDGSIIIDTGLDTKGFDKGSKELLNAVSSLTKEVNQLGKTLQATFSGYGKSAENSDAKARQLEDTVRNLEAKVQSLKASIAELETGLKAVGGQKIIDPAVFSSVSGKAAAFEKEMAKLGGAVDSMGKLADAALGGDAQAMDEFDSAAGKAYDTIEGLKQRLEAFGNTKFETDDYKWVQAEITKADNSLQKLLDRQAKMDAMGVKASSRSYQSLQYDIEQAKAKLDDLIATRQIYENSGNAITTGTDTEQYRQYSAALSAIEGQLAGMKEKVDSAFTPDNAEQWSSIVCSAFDSVVSSIRRVAGGAKNAAVSLAKMVSGSVLKGLRRLGSFAAKAAKSVFSLGKRTKKTNAGLKGGLLTVLKYGLGLQSLQTLIGKLKGCLTDGFKNLAQYSDKTNASISSVMSALTKFKNSIAAAFAPLVNAAAPAVTLLINKLSEAVSKLGQFFAALTGQKSFIKAKDVQEDYAESLKDTSEAAKETSRQLAGFDDLEILKDNKKDDEDEKKPDPSQMFEEVPLDSGIKNIVDMFKSAWENADFYDIGRMFGEKLRDALESIPWDKIKTVLRKIAKSIATFLNGFLETPGLFTAIGKTVAEAVNSAFEFLDSFAWNFHWDSLGTAIMDMVAGICDNLDWSVINSAVQGIASGLGNLVNTVFGRRDVWEKAGTTLGKSLNTVVSGALTFIEKIDFRQAGSNVAAGINKAFSAIDWATAGKTISEAVKGLLEGLAQLIEDIDWQQLGKNIAEALKNIDWNGIVETMCEAFGTALGGLAGLLWGLIEEAWNSLVDWWHDVAFEDGEFTIEGLLDGIVQAVKNIGTWVKEHIVDPFVEGFKKAFGIHSPSTVMAEQGKYLIEGLFQGILGMIKGIGKWMKQNVLKPIQDAFKKAGATIEVGVQLIKDGWENLKSFVGNKVQAFVSLVKSGWTSLSDFAGNTITAFVSLVKQGWNSISSFVGSAVTVAISLIKRGWSAVSSFVGTTVTVAVSLIRQGWTALTDFVGKTVSVGIQLVKLGWESVTAFIGKSVSVSVSLVKQGWDRLTNFIGTAITVSVSLIRQGWTALSDFVGTTVSASVSLVKRGWNTISEFVGTAVSTAVTLTKNGWSTITGFVGGTVSVFVSLVKQGWTTISNFVGTAVTTVITLAKSGWSTISGFVGTVVTAAITLAKKGWSTISDFVGTAVTTVITLAKNGWTTISNFVGTAVTTVITLAKSGWSTISGFVGTAVTAVVTLARNGWTSLTSWVGNTLSVAISLAKKGWSTISSWIGHIPTLNQAISLVKSGWTSIKNFVGDAVSVGISLIKKGWSSLSSFIGGAVSIAVSLMKSGWSSISSWIGSVPSVSVGISLVKKGWRNIADFVGNSVQVGISLFKSGWTSIKKFFGLENGGIVGANGGVKAFSSGGVIMNSGRSNWWNSIQKYAGGTSRAHGTMFVAGESGPEVVGHVNGRTEVLNKSQIAEAMYTAVITAMSGAVNALGSYLAQHMASCANAIISSILFATNFTTPVPVSFQLNKISGEGATLIGRLSALSGGVGYSAPVYSAGTVIPYEIAAKIESAAADIQQSIDEMNEGLSQIIISAIASQTSALLAALQELGRMKSGVDTSGMVQQTIDEINRRTLMFSGSPLKG